MSLATIPSGFTCSRTDWFASLAASRLRGREVRGVFLSAEPTRGCGTPVSLGRRRLFHVQWMLEAIACWFESLETHRVIAGGSTERKFERMLHSSTFPKASSAQDKRAACAGS